MKILVTTPYVSWPANFGGAVRTLSIVRALGKIGHQVVLLTPSPTGGAGDTDAAIDWRSYPSGSSIAHFCNPQFSRVYRSVLTENPDLVLAEFPYQAAMILGPARKRGIPVIYDAHNVEVDRFRNMKKPLVSSVVRLTESYICRHADCVFVTSESDRDLLSRYYGKSGIVLPNGVDTERFIPREPDSELQISLDLVDKKVALFFGTLNYGPNREALEFLVREVWPQVMAEIPDGRLLIVGRNAPGWIRNFEGVVVAGAVEDMASHIRLANVVLAPLFSGGGTRLKIIEALSCGQTVLSTPFGAEGLAVESNPALILAGRNQFAHKLIAILREELLPGKNELARQEALKYDWNTIVSTIDWENFSH